MPRFFTVDRTKQLHEGKTITLIQYRNVQPQFLQHHLDSLFPDGVSQHGETYIVSGEPLANDVNSVLELLFEYVRRSTFPMRPSRFQSVFAFSAMDDAIEFRSKRGRPDDPI